MTLTPADPWAITTARQILPHDAPREEWLEARRLGIGGSDASTLLGFNPWASLLELWLDKTGRGSWRDNYDNAAMEWGRRLEPVIRDYFAETTGLTVHPSGLLRSIDHPIMQVTLDGLCSDGGILEIKTTSWRQASEWSDEQVADHAELQTQHGMAVTGREFAWVIVLIDGRTPLIRRVARDEQIIEALIEASEGFWADHVETDEAPALSGGNSENDAMRSWYPVQDPDKAIPATPELVSLLGRLEDAKLAVKDADAVVTGLDTRVRGLIGDAEYVVTVDPDDPGQEPRPVATLRANGTFSTKRFVASEPDLAEEFTVEQTVTALDTNALKLTKPDVHTRYRARVLRTTKLLAQLREGA